MRWSSPVDRRGDTRTIELIGEGRETGGGTAKGTVNIGLHEAVENGGTADDASRSQCRS